MFKKALLALGLIGWSAYGLIPIAQVQAQNTTCSDRVATDSSNACANTRFTHAAIINDFLDPSISNALVIAIAQNPTFWLNCLVFTSTTNGCVPLSGGGTVNFLRADGQWAPAAGTIPIGGVIPWSGASVPAGYLLTFGQAVARASFPQLLTTITFQPTISCSSGSPTIAVAIGTSDRVPVGTPIEASACFAAGTVVASKGSGTLTMNNNAGATTSTTAIIFPWGNGDGSTTFNVPNISGRTIVGRNNMSGSASGNLTSTFYGAVPDAVNVAGGLQTSTLVTANLPAYTPAGSFGGTATVNDPGHTHSIPNFTTWLPPSTPGVTSGGVAASLSLITPGVTDSHTTGITVDLSGTTWIGTPAGGTSDPFRTVQPSITMDYIIKAADLSTTDITNLTVGITTITGGSNNTILYDNGGILGELSIATVPERLAGTALKIIDGTSIYPEETVVTYGTTTTLNFATFLQASITLTGNITTMNVSNVHGGRAGSIAFIQDGTGSRTTVWNSVFKFAGGTAPTLSTTASAVDILSYSCRTPTFCSANLIKDVR